MPPPARGEWHRLAPILGRLGVLTEVDGEALAELCTARSKLHAQVLEGKFPVSLWRSIMAMEGRFGLTPADRARIEVPGPKADDGDWT